MKSITGIFFECKVRYKKTFDDGMERKTIEQYAVEAQSWTEAEARITEEMSSLVSGELNVPDIKVARYDTVFLSDSANDNKFYKVRVSFTTIDEKTEKEKHTSDVYLMQSATIDGAKKAIDEALCGSMVDYAVKKIAETKLLDVFTYKSDENKKDEI